MAYWHALDTQTPTKEPHFENQEHKQQQNGFLKIFCIMVILKIRAYFHTTIEIIKIFQNDSVPTATSLSQVVFAVFLFDHKLTYRFFDLGLAFTDVFKTAAIFSLISLIRNCGLISSSFTHFGTKLCKTVKNFFTAGVMKHWNRLPREVVQVPSLEIFKTCWDAPLWDGLAVGNLLLQGVGLSDLQWSFPTPVILWCYETGAETERGIQAFVIFMVVIGGSTSQNFFSFFLECTYLGYEWEQDSYCTHLQRLSRSQMRAKKELFLSLTCVCFISMTFKKCN